MIYVLGGTKDSRELVEHLVQADYEVIVSVASEYGKQLLTEIGDVEIISKRLDKRGIKEIIMNYGVKIVVDATHPFASKVSQNVLEATVDLGIRSIRFERETISIPEDKLVIKKYGFQSAIDYLNQSSKRILLTIGSKELAKFVEGIDDFEERAIVRVLPTAKVLDKCQQKLAIPPANIIAMQGPFSSDLNQQILIDYEIDLLVTKASGKTGGLDTKLQATQELEIPILIIERPELDYPEITYDYKQLLDALPEN
jgi:precorrin-6A/cobalt-precorrin-6A reductase